MRKLTVLSPILLVTLLLSGCMQPVQQARSSAAIAGNVTYDESTALPNKAMVTVQLRDADLWPGATGLMSQQQITNQRQPSADPVQRS